MFKKILEQILDGIDCIKYFAAFSWKEYPLYYFYVVLGIIVNSVGPFITIIGSKNIINEIAYKDKRDMDNIFFWVMFVCLGTLLYRSLQKFANERQYYCADRFDRAMDLELSTRAMKMKFEYTENSQVLDEIKRAERAFEESGVDSVIEGITHIISGIFVFAGVFYLVVSCSVLLLIPIVLSFVVSSVVTMKKTKLEEEYYKTYSDQVREQDYYMQNLTESRYAKDIRIYNASQMILENQKLMGERIYGEAKKNYSKIWKYMRVDSIVSQSCNVLIYMILGAKNLF